MLKDILLIQPPLLHANLHTDTIQEAYWKVLKQKVYSMISDMPDSVYLKEHKDNFTGFIEPNIGLFYVAGSLRKAGFHLDYLDFHILDSEIRLEKNRTINEEDIKDRLRDYACDIVLISPLTVNFHWAVKIAEMCKQINPTSISIVGGVHASFEYENILKKYPSVDYVIIGEGELSSVQLLQNLTAGQNIDSIDGIAYRQNGNVLFTGKAQPIADLDSLPYPDYSLIDKKYIGNSMLRVITSRGCSNRCNFCVPSSFFSNLRFRDYTKVVDELEFLKDEYGIKMFMIGDLNFLSDYDYAKKFCQEIITRKLNLFWMCQSRVDLISSEIVDVMKEAGCNMICLGMESGNQDILNSSNKNITLQRSMEACSIVKKAGLYLFTFWVFGLPGETHESAFQTIQLLRKMINDKLIDYTHCTVFTPYPGTAIYNNPDKYGINVISDDFSEYWMGCDYLGADLPVVHTRDLTNYEIYAYWQLALAVVAGNL